MVTDLLSNFDIALIFAYFIILILIGYFTSRKQKEEDYLIAERKLGTFSTMMTMNASKTGSILMIFVALTYLWGFSAIWYFIGVVTGIIIFIPFALKLKEQSKNNYYTLADYFKYNYGKRSAAIVSALTILLMFGFLVINLIGATKLFTFFTGWPFWLCAIIVMLVIILYTLLAGFKAVVKTDILQYIAIVFILILLTFLLFNGSLIPASDWNFFQANLVTIIGFFIVGIISPFGGPDLWQRVYSSKNKKSLKHGLIWSVIIYAIIAFLLSLIALTVKAQFPNIDPDLALVHGFANLLPQGILGLSVVLLFAAIMSSIDTYMFTASSSIVQDFFRLDKKRIVKAIRKAILIVAIVATILSILIQDLIVGSYIFVTSIVIIALAVISTWIKKSIKERTILSGLILGIIGLIAFLLYSLTQGEVDIAIVSVTLIATILGLALGGIYSKIKQQ